VESKKLGKSKQHPLGYSHEKEWQKQK